MPEPLPPPPPQPPLPSDTCAGSASSDTVPSSSGFDPETSNWFGSISPDSDTPHPAAVPASPPTGPDPDRDLNTLIHNRYRLFKRVGFGGMGVVFAARDEMLDRTVAVKTILCARGNAAVDPELTRRFDREARITCQLQHPGIPAVHDLGKLPDGRPYMVMKLIKGHTLAQILKDRASAPDTPRDVAPLLQAFEAVCQTVGYAHSRQVIHRDLSPQNVMVGAFGEVQVMDWGLAKVLSRVPVVTDGSADTQDTEGLTVIDPDGGRVSSDPSATESAVGKFAYMPPEQAREEDVHRVDRRSDVFGLGAIQCEILTGKPPYTGTKMVVRAAATMWLTEEVFARLDGCGADPELIALVKRCLAKNPADRPADGVEVAAAVGNYRASVDARLRQAEIDKTAAEVRAIEAGSRAEVEERAKQAALARADAERAKVAEQRKRRHTQVGLLAATLALVATVAAGLVWREHRNSQDATREAEERTKAVTLLAVTERDVVAALDEARQLRIDAGRMVDQPDRWEDKLKLAASAIEAAKKVRDRGDPENTLGLAARIDHEFALLAAANTDRKFVARLEEIAGYTAVRNARGRVGEWYADTFHKYGPDPLTLAPEECGRRVREHPHALILLAALADWHLRVPRNHPAQPRLEAVIRHAFPEWLAVCDNGRTIRFNLDDLKTMTGRLAPARRDQANALPPRHPRVVEFLAARVRVEGRPVLALELIEWGLEDNQSDYRLNVQLADTAIGLSRPDIWDNPDRPVEAADEPPRGLAFYLPRATRRLTDAVIIRPGHPAVHIALGQAYLLDGDPQNAIVCFRRLVTLDGTNVDALTNLRDACYAADRMAEAEDVARRVIELDGANPHAYAALGLIMSRMQRADELGEIKRKSGVIECHRRAVRLDGKSPEFRFNLAVALAAVQEYAAATREYETALAAGAPIGRFMFDTSGRLIVETRVQAARQALLAGQGYGIDPPPAAEARRFRRLALTWLKAELDTYRPKRGLFQIDIQVIYPFQDWQKDSVLSLTRFPASLLTLPADERAEWAAFWVECDKVVELNRKKDGP